MKENKDYLVEIQIDMETVTLNGDREKARSNVIRGIIIKIIL